MTVGIQGLFRLAIVVLCGAMALPAWAGDWTAAVHNNRLEVLHRDLERVDDVDQTTKAGKTALMAASGRGDLVLVNALLDQGADPNRANDRGGTALLYAALAGDPQVLQRLLQAGAELEHQAGNGWNALILAAAKGRLAAVRLLLAHDADANPTDVHGWTALMRAIDNGHKATALWLAGREAVDVTHANHRGQTALHLAVLAGQEAVARVLLARGASMDAADRDGRTPRDIALALGRELPVR